MIIWSSDESEIEKFELGKVVKIMENVKDKAGSMDELKELAAKAGAMENKPMREKRDIDLSTPCLLYTSPSPRDGLQAQNPY